MSWRTEETCCHRDSSEIPPAHIGAKKSQGIIIIMIIDKTNKWYIHNPESVLENKTQKYSFGFCDTHGLSNLGQTTRPIDCQQQKRTRRKVDFAVPVDHRLKVKESEKRDKCQDLSRELKILRNMKMTMIVIVICDLSTVLIQGVEDLEIRGRVQTIQSTALVRSARILRRGLET